MDKTRFRLTVHAPDTANLVKWTGWAAANVTADTRRVLHSVGVGFQTWFVFVGIIERSAITECVEAGKADWRAEKEMGTYILIKGA